MNDATIEQHDGMRPAGSEPAPRQASATLEQDAPSSPVPTVPAAADYRAPAGSMARQGSWLKSATRNVDIIDLARRIDAERLAATLPEQQQLSRYIGFGASMIRNVLFPVPTAQQKAADPAGRIWPALVSRPGWRALAERHESLPDEWQRSMLQSTQYAHFTAKPIIRPILHSPLIFKSPLDAGPVRSRRPPR